jgi:hypothetical protein
MPVIPAKAGTQDSSRLLLGPRFRGDDEFGCQQDLLTASFPLEDGEGGLVDNLYINYFIDNISNA